MKWRLFSFVASRIRLRKTLIRSEVCRFATRTQLSPLQKMIGKLFSDPSGYIWIWWVHGESRLSQSSMDLLKQNEETGLGISIISCWEVAKLVENKRLTLPSPVEAWLEKALQYPGIRLLPLTPRIVVES